jgi:hypothetical protein
MKLQRFSRPERLTARLAVGITLLVIVPLAGGLYLLARHQYEQTIAARRAAAELENRILEAALRHQMMRQRRSVSSSLVLAAHVVDGDDVGVGQGRHRPGLGLETAQPVRRRRTLGGDELEGHLAAETGIAGAVDLTHPPGSQGGQDLIGAQTGSTR